MTKFRASARLVAATAALCVTLPTLTFAQAAGQDQPPVRPSRGQAGASRPALPPVGRGMNAMQLQQHLDAFALIQAEQQLKLSTEQYSAFAPKLIRLQTVRRRMMQSRRRLLNELNQLLIAPTPSDEQITEKTKAFDDVKLTPTIVVIDKRGNVVKRILGEPDFAALEKLIEDKLADPA